MDELVEGLLKLAIGLILVAAVVVAILWIVGAALWFAVTALVSVPAAAGAYGLMWGAEHMYCRDQVKRLKQQGKLGDMIQVSFEDSGIRWSMDDDKLRNMGNSILLLILFVTGVVGIWLLLFLLGQLGVFRIQLGLVGDANVANQINEVMAYVSCAAAIGLAMVIMPKQLHRAINFQARAHVQGQNDRLDKANTLFRSALNLLEETAELLPQAGSATLVKELDKLHAALHSPDLADFVRNEEWDGYDTYIKEVVRDLNELKRIAEDFETGFGTDDSIPGPQPAPPPHSDVMTELKAYKELEISPQATPAEVKQKVENLRRKYNVDQRQGLDEHVRDLLEKKNTVVNQAYQFLQDLGKAL
jgi:hypothetical protein